MRIGGHWPDLSCAIKFLRKQSERALDPKKKKKNKGGLYHGLYEIQLDDTLLGGIFILFSAFDRGHQVIFSGRPSGDALPVCSVPLLILVCGSVSRSWNDIVLRCQDIRASIT